MNHPILITGTHRSGTTWVGNILSKNPAYELIYEPFNLHNKPGRHWISFEKWFTFVCKENEEKYRKGLENTFSFRYSPWLKLSDMPNWNGLKQCYFEAKAYKKFRKEKKVPLVKDPIAFFSAPYLAETFNMNVLVLIRHPAAFVSSLKRMGWGFNGLDLLSQPLLMQKVLMNFQEELENLTNESLNDIDQMCCLWNIFHTVILEYQNKYPDWIFVRHEDLSLEPEKAFQKLCEKLDIDFNPEMKAYIKQLNDTKKGDVEGQKLHQLKRNSQHNIKIWKERLTAEEINQIRTKTELVSNRFYSNEDW